MKSISLGLALFALVLGACAKSTSSGTGGSPSATPTGAFGVTKDATIAAELPAAAVAKGTLVVATDASYAPDEFIGPDNKTIVGMDIDLANAIAGVLGLKFNYVNAKFDTIITGVLGGRYDLSLSSFTDNLDREKTVDFVTYFQAGEAIFVAADSKANFTSLDQLCGKPVSVESGTTELDDINAQNPKCKAEGKPEIIKHVFPDQNATNLDLISGHAVASLADSQVAAYQVKVTNGKVKVLTNYVAPAPYGIVLPRPAGSAKGSGALDKAILDALKKLIADGIYKQILDKWGVAAGAITTPTINGATS
jgi:polar amino acid transport system substrate-binding protein